MKPESNNCWICGDAGTTGEHKSKRSDLRATFGKTTQANPIYLSDNTRENRKIGSLDNRHLKSDGRLCPKCNNERSQPFDRAWEHMSDKLRNLSPPIVAGSTIRANSIFKYNTRSQMRRVHLFFVKLFGCHIVEANIPIDVSGFAHAFIDANPHPLVHLRFGLFRTEQQIVGMSDIEIAQFPDGSCAFATWFYEVDRLGVNVLFAAEGEKREGLVGAWHPRYGAKRLVIHDFDGKS